MVGFRSFAPLNAAIFIAFLLLGRPAYGQISTLCTSSMLQSFNPCINYLASGSGSSPTADCCDSLKTLMSSGRDCLCLIFTGGIGFKVPINQTLAASLPRACKTSGVPIECKALPGSPIPAPGPTAFDSPPPSWLPEPNTPPFTPPGNAAGSDGTPTPPGNAAGGDGTLTPPGNAAGGDGILTPPSFPGLTPGYAGFPAMTPPGIRPDLSTAQPSLRFSHLILIALFGATAFTCF